MEAPKSSLFIGDLSIFCTEKDLEDHFSPYGKLVEVKIMKSEDRGRSLSYGFVKFADPSDAARAMAGLQHTLLKGRHLRIAWASYRNRTASNIPMQTASSQEPLESSAVHVSFISYQIRSLVTEASLRSLFSNYGEVTDVSIKKSSVDTSTNRQSGYGFIHYPISHAGIVSAIRAAEELRDTTIEEVNYKSSLSHKLTVFIEENASFFGSNHILKQIPNPKAAPPPEALNFKRNEYNHGKSTNQPHNFNYYSEPMPSVLPSPPMPHRPAPTFLPPYHPSLQTSHYPPDRGFMMQPMMAMPHFVPPSPSPHQYPYEPHMQFSNPNMGMNTYSIFPSPGQANSPLPYYLNDRFACTPSSISSVDTFCDQIIGSILISPPSPLNTVMIQQPSNNRNLMVNNAKSSNLNLKKLRQKQIRKQMNQLDPVAHISKRSGDSNLDYEDNHLPTEDQLPHK